MEKEFEKETVYELLKDIRDTLYEINDFLKYKFSSTVDDLVYYRVASTYDEPVPAKAKDYKLLDFKVPQYVQALVLYAVGSDQHDNSYYRWVVDDIDMPISGKVAVGSPEKPFYFKEPVIVRRYVALYVTNNNDVPYPNTGPDPLDPVPYEAVIIGRWLGWGRSSETTRGETSLQQR